MYCTIRDHYCFVPLGFETRDVIGNVVMSFINELGRKVGRRGLALLYPTFIGGNTHGNAAMRTFGGQDISDYF